MAIYRTDPDLFFLAQCHNDDLEFLVSLITHDPKDGSLRWSETLSGSEDYKRFYPNHQEYWQGIAAEVQTFGANSFVNILRRGKGVMYRELLCDACDKMKVNYSKKASTENIELNMLMKVLEKSLSDMSSEQLKEFATGMEIELSNPTPELILMAIQTAIRASGFAAYKMAVVVVSTVAKALLGRGLQFGTYVLLTRSISALAGPVGWALSSLWLATDLAGPAYRITIPACLLIAYMRQKALYLPV
ncbi:oxidoreductase [Rouxiella silvae]|uniref:Oxidoreductase n=1 Tax=Rouxiella silvae TaxID=1646373 RepID=A0ABX3TUN3_9GAMM|nr:DUF3944 domain-containing protein [Rouxiella silvae]ORJ18935.1 oxidoreductase [Rouxiella silvae]